MRGSAAEEIAMAAAAITECTWLVPVGNFHDGLPENLRDLVLSDVVIGAASFY